MPAVLVEPRAVVHVGADVFPEALLQGQRLAHGQPKADQDLLLRMFEAMHQHLQRGAAHAPHLRADDHEFAGYRADIVPRGVIEHAALFEVHLTGTTIEHDW
ncbi:hypothetical protein D3C85_1681720 [compost metagenome]